MKNRTEPANADAKLTTPVVKEEYKDIEKELFDVIDQEIAKLNAEIQQPPPNQPASTPTTTQQNSNPAPVSQWKQVSRSTSSYNLEGAAGLKESQFLSNVRKSETIRSAISQTSSGDLTTNNSRDNSAAPSTSTSNSAPASPQTAPAPSSPNEPSSPAVEARPSKAQHPNAPNDRNSLRRFKNFKLGPSSFFGKRNKTPSSMDLIAENSPGQASVVEAPPPPEAFEINKALFTFPQESLQYFTDERGKIIKEIYTSEANYVKNLHIIHMVKSPKPPTQTPFTEMEVKEVFSNVDTILNFHVNLLKELNVRIAEWNPANLADCSIGEIFTQVTPYLKMYTQYCDNYDLAMTTIKEKLKKSKETEAFLKWVLTTYGQSLQSFLIMPVQRIPRYQLLISDLIKKTNEAEFAYDMGFLKMAIAQIKDIADTVNKSIAAAESKRRTAMVMSKYEGAEKLGNPAGRQFLAEGRVEIVQNEKNNGEIANWILIFNDVLAFTVKREEGEILDDDDIEKESKNDDGKDKSKEDKEDGCGDDGEERVEGKIKVVLPINLMWLKDLKDEDRKFLILSPEWTFSITCIENTPHSKEHTPANSSKEQLNHSSSSLVVDGANGSEATGVVINGPSAGGIRKKFWMDILNKALNDYLNKEAENEPGLTIERDLTFGKRFGRFTFSDGANYRGWWKDRKPDGKGGIEYSNGTTYDGEWKKGLREGKGVITYTTGHVYDGDWLAGRPHGQGVLTCSADGTKYVGGWRIGMRHGEGTLFWSNGVKYTGNWVNNRMNGYGEWECETVVNSNKSSGDGSAITPNQNGSTAGSAGIVGEGDKKVYKGYWKDDKRHGKGEMIKYVKGEEEYRYEGEWANDMREGSGKEVWKHGDVYTGEYKNNTKHGKGVFVYSGSSDRSNKKGRYEGDFESDEREGYGEWEDAEGKYKGNWKAGKRSGSGEYTAHDNSTHYSGEWVADSREGKGEETYNGGLGGRYVGSWHNNERFAEGTMKGADGSVYDGRWHKGKREGKGVMVWSNGDRYDGTWHLGKRGGTGIWTSGDGKMKYEGGWENDAKSGDQLSSS
eukprot:TRINITY_DN7175_c0_g1_i2.p1 TRINITY_DN7175_c0_g1~~TRINITY_DN7175_c0_g1_i2.p1  ORF type:complete len:1115 (+),score=312.51 TRINITY_DN7175_c0_g1_i2:162-3347(+)